MTDVRKREREREEGPGTSTDARKVAFSQTNNCNNLNRDHPLTFSTKSRPQNNAISPQCEVTDDEEAYEEENKEEVRSV